MLKTFRTYQLAVQFYKDIKRLGLKGELRDQLERAALHLAEGSGKSRDKDRRRFFEIAMGSARESQALVSLLDHPELADQADKLGAYLWNLIQSFR